MILKAIGQLLMAVSLFRVLPVDASILEAQVEPARSYPQFSHLLLASGKAHLSLAETVGHLPPKKVVEDSYGVLTSADSVIVVDEASGATLYAEEPDAVRPMGSITKLMAVMVFLDGQPKLDQTVQIIKDDYVAGGRVYLNYNDGLSLRSVLGASLVGSDNTATNALVRLSGLTEEEFVTKMNEKAGELGLSTTHFVDATGISADNASTARELSVLLESAKGYPLMQDYMTRDSYTVTQNSGFSVAIPSTDALLVSSLNAGDYKITGGKTGYIPQAGYCLATSVEFEGHNVLIVVLGAEQIEDRFSDATALAKWSFKTFVWPKL